MNVPRSNNRVSPQECVRDRVKRGKRTTGSTGSKTGNDDETDGSQRRREIRDFLLGLLKEWRDQLTSIE
jgi:hypothetical protein